MVTTKTDIENIVNDLSMLSKKHPYLIHSWRFALGAVYALGRARQYHVERGSFKNGGAHVSQMQQVVSQIRAEEMPDEVWLAGLHFNSALIRIAAFYERSLRSPLKESLNNDRITIPSTGKAKKVKSTNVEELLQVIDERFFKKQGPFKRDSLEKVRTEVNRLKHEVLGQLPQDAVAFPEAIEATREILTFLKFDDISQELKTLYGAMSTPA